MQDMEKLNDQEMAGVVGGISGDQALEASLKHAGLRKDQLSTAERSMRSASIRADMSTNMKWMRPPVGS